MREDSRTNRTKRSTWIKVDAVRWLRGSTRDELTVSERAVWIDFLCEAGINDPPGQIDFTTLRRLANQLNISQKLLNSAIKKALLNDKIKIVKFVIDPDTREKFIEDEFNYDQIETKMKHLGTNRSKIGISLYAIIILNWNIYQSEYLRQKPYRKKEKKPDKNLENLTPNSVTQVTDRGEERRKEEIRGDEKTEENPTIQQNCNCQPPLPSNPINSFRGKTIKEEFLSMLRNCTGYPFDEDKDSLLFDLTVQDYPGINILEQLSIKIKWWKEHPDALKADIRKQLKEWFRSEHEFKKRGGPQAIGDIINIPDPDFRNWIGQIQISPSKKKPGLDN